MLWRAIAALLLVLAGACRAAEPPTNPEEVCVRACSERAGSRCSGPDCHRGCRLALDRLVEHEGERVIACIAGAKSPRCDDATWADCAVRVGGHADGGPPAPVVKGEDEDEP
jgi:hypothetical protein